MKQRLKIDGVILTALITFSIALYAFPKLFNLPPMIWDVLRLASMVIILKGAFIRMSARGHKTALSPKGWGLATDGLYAYTRNPMYLGTFMITLGFIVMAWPWWAVPVFVVLFYLRFIPQVRLEEAHLKNIFGQQYEAYCQKVPRFLPSLPAILRINKRKECPWEELWTTKEKRLVIFLPVIALVLQIAQSWWLYGDIPLLRICVINLLGVGLFWFHLLYEYRLKYGKDTK